MSGLDEILYIGNLDAKRLGHAKDYVEIQWKIIQQKPDDFVIATGKTKV